MNNLKFYKLDLHGTFHSQVKDKVDKFIVTDWVGNPRAIIETIKVQQVPFNKITSEFAEIEGEGDKSLGYWRKVHEAYYKREMATYIEKFDKNMIIVCEYFKKIF